MGDARHLSLTSTRSDDAGRDSIGGAPILAAGQTWPVCFCGKRMVLFFQLDVRDVPPFVDGSHLLVFQCPEHNEANFAPDDGVLPASYWNLAQALDGPFWRIYLNKPGPESKATESEKHLEPKSFTFGTGNGGGKAIQLGGNPRWWQGEEKYSCTCGAEMSFLCQVPENYGFDKAPDAPEQPNTFDSKQYGLFLGNEVYVLACAAQCQPLAVWPVNQN